MISKSLRTVLSNKLPGRDKQTYAFDLIIAERPISNMNISITRSYAALRAADLDWIVGPGYSLGRVHSGEKHTRGHKWPGRGAGQE